MKKYVFGVDVGGTTVKMGLFNVDGEVLEKWEIKKIFPIDKKDAKINELEEEIKKLKEVLNEHYRPNRKRAITQRYRFF